MAVVTELYKEAGEQHRGHQGEFALSDTEALIITQYLNRYQDLARVECDDNYISNRSVASTSCMLEGPNGNLSYLPTLSTK